MASKVMVKIPVAPFGNKVNQKGGNLNSDIIVNSRTSDIVTRSTDTIQKSPEQCRISQLEENIRFLKDQHKLLVTGLHNEIENLKRRNRELQFQLVFIKGSTSGSSASSPEDDTKHKTVTSPSPSNKTPLKVEILEKELFELKLQIQETSSRNAYLSVMVDEQKRKLEGCELDRGKVQENTVQPDLELLRKLEDAEIMIRRLRRENSDLRRDNSVGQCSSQDTSHLHHQGNGDTRYCFSRSGLHGQHSGRGNGGRYRGNNGHYRGNWFPPVHSHSYWQGGRNHERLVPNEKRGELPSLRGNEDHNQSRKVSNNNHYNGANRKYRRDQKNGEQQT